MRLYLQMVQRMVTQLDRGWSGGAKVLGKLSVPGRPTSLDDSRARAYCACTRCGWGFVWTFFSLIYLFSFLSPSLWEKARYRLKYCLKGPLNPKQPTTAGSACVTPSDTYKCRLPDNASIFSVEIKAIDLALDYIEQSRNTDFIIFSDSLPVLQSLHNNHIENPLLLDVLLKHKLRKAFSKFYRRHFDILSKYNVGLKTLLLQGLSEPEFYGDLVYKFRKIIGKNDFPYFKKVIVCYKKIGYNINVMRQTACLVVNPIKVNSFAYLFNCTTVGRTSD